MAAILLVRHVLTSVCKFVRYRNALIRHSSTHAGCSGCGSLFQGDKMIGICYNRGDEKGYVYTLFIDASWGSDLSISLPTSGMLVTLCGSLVVSESKRQRMLLLFLPKMSIWICLQRHTKQRGFFIYFKSSARLRYLLQSQMLITEPPYRW